MVTRYGLDGPGDRIPVQGDITVQTDPVPMAIQPTVKRVPNFHEVNCPKSDVRNPDILEKNCELVLNYNSASPLWLLRHFIG